MVTKEFLALKFSESEQTYKHTYRTHKLIVLSCLQQSYAPVEGKGREGKVWGASMAATRSFSSVALLTFYAFTFLFLTRGPIQNGSKCLLRRPLGLFLTGTVFSGDAGLIFVVKLGGKFRLDLRSESYFKSSLPVTKWTKHGSTSLHIPGHDPPLDKTVQFWKAAVDFSFNSRKMTGLDFRTAPYFITHTVLG